MSYDREATRKQPRTVGEIQELEDRLAKVQQDLRDIRLKMGQEKIETVDLLLGTFTFHLGKLEPLAKRYMGKLEEQIVVQKVKKAREAIKKK